MLMLLERSPKVKTTILPDGYVVLHSLDTDWAHTLTPQAALIWELCDGDHEIDEIAQEISQLINVENCKSFQEDLASLIEELRRDGLLISKSDGD